jgi:hypothetical protein
MDVGIYGMFGGLPRVCKLNNGILYIYFLIFILISQTYHKYHYIYETKTFFIAIDQSAKNANVLCTRGIFYFLHKKDVFLFGKD